LRLVRNERNISEERLGLDAGFDRTYVSVVERRLRSPTIRSLVRLSVGLDVRPSEIVLRMEELLPNWRRNSRRHCGVGARRCAALRGVAVMKAWNRRGVRRAFRPGSPARPAWMDIRLDDPSNLARNHIRFQPVVLRSLLGVGYSLATAWLQPPWRSALGASPRTYEPALRRLQMGCPDPRCGSEIRVEVGSITTCIELMGGAIELERTPGVGTCFRVELRVDLAEEFEVEETAEIELRRRPSSRVRRSIASSLWKTSGKLDGAGALAGEHRIPRPEWPRMVRRGE
jgi:transcriptional regulator with XRE-family HTH domain